MTRRVRAGLVAVLVSAVGPRIARSQGAGGTTHAGRLDPYAPLELYNGRWLSQTTGDKPDPAVDLVNHCARTGLFFVCEQVVNGENQALVVFLPTGASADTLLYRTQGLSAHADKAGDWGHLTIIGDRWVYSDDEIENGATVHWRTVNVFTGPDRIHFERQRSADGKSWTTTMAGDEHRVGASP